MFRTPIRTLSKKVYDARIIINNFPSRDGPKARPVIFHSDRDFSLFLNSVSAVGVTTANDNTIVRSLKYINVEECYLLEFTGEPAYDERIQDVSSRNSFQADDIKAFEQKANRGLVQWLRNMGVEKVEILAQGLQIFHEGTLVGNIDGLVETADASYVIESKLQGKVADIRDAMEAAALVNNKNVFPVVTTKFEPIVVLAVSDGVTEEMRDKAAASKVILLVEQQDGDFKFVESS